MDFLFDDFADLPASIYEVEAGDLDSQREEDQNQMLSDQLEAWGVPDDIIGSVDGMDSGHVYDLDLDVEVAYEEGDQ